MMVPGTVVVRLGWLGAAALVVLCGCDDTGVIFRVASDRSAAQLDTLCLELDAGGAARFGRSYGLAAHPLPQTITAVSQSRSAVQALVSGFFRGQPVARDRRNLPLRSGEVLHVDLSLDACLASPTDARFSAAAAPSGVGAGAIDRAVMLPSTRGPGGTVMAFGGGKVSLFDASGTTLTADAEELAAPASGAVSGLGALDLDGDCRGDLLVSSSGAPPSEWLRAADGGFPLASPLPAAAGAFLATGDVDGDGTPDLLSASGVQLQLFLNDGKAAFREMAGAFDTPPSAANGVALGDLDGDGNLDALVTQDGAPPLVYLADAQGSGHFTQVAAAFPPRALHPTAVTLVDLDGDGDLDVVLATLGDGLRLYLNRGDGFLEDRTFALLGADAGGDVAGALVADLNADCFADVLVARVGAAPQLLLGTGGGNLAAGPDLGVGEIAGASAEDVDGDGRLDLLLYGPRGLDLLVQK